MKISIPLIAAITVFCFSDLSAGVVKYAGCRQSAYGTWQSDQNWEKILKNMASYYPTSTPLGIWIVGTLGSGGTCDLEFPSPGGSIPNTNFQSTDKHEATLDYFDQAGIKVLLQVESGFANEAQIIDVVLNQYKHHSCVIGMGIDVEWYDNIDGEGTPVTDVVAQTWEQKVKSHNSSYKLFLKHWEESYMPPSYRGDIIFVNDHQEMESLWRLKEYFHTWARDYPDNIVLYQGGYPEDYTWWGALSNPPKDIGDALAEVINPNQEMGMIWVDFSLDYDEVAGLFDSDFTPSKLKVTTLALNPGSITLSPAGGLYDYGTQVTATAAPFPRALFRSWAGHVTGTNNSVTFTVTRNMSVKALFGYDAVNITDMLDDFEDGDNTNIIGGLFYSDDGNSPDSGGTSANNTVTPHPDSTFVMAAGGANSSKYAAKITYTLDQGTLLWYPHVGFGSRLNTSGPDLGDATGLSFYHKGRACYVQYETSDVKDSAYYYHHVQDHNDWTLVVVALANFKQPTDWGATVPFKPENGTAISWKIEDQDGTQNEAWVDDVRITGVEFDVVAEAHQFHFNNAAPAISMKVFNRKLQVSYPSIGNKPVIVSVFNPEGKLVREVNTVSSNNKRQSALVDISSLAGGVYFVTLQSCEKNAEVYHGKFNYTR